MNAGEKERSDSPRQLTGTGVMVEDAADNARPRSPRRRKTKGLPSDAPGMTRDRSATSESSLRTLKQGSSSPEQSLLRQVYSFSSHSQRRLRTGGRGRPLSLPSIPDFDRWASSSDVDVVSSMGSLEETMQTDGIESVEKSPVKANASCPVRRRSDSDKTLVSLATALEQSDNLDIFLDGL
jgi:hypothetical protein